MYESKVHRNILIYFCERDGGLRNALILLSTFVPKSNKPLLRYNHYNNINDYLSYSVPVLDVYISRTYVQILINYQTGVTSSFGIKFISKLYSKDV